MHIPFRVGIRLMLVLILSIAARGPGLAAADEAERDASFGVGLFADDSLAGWNDGPASTEGWSMRAGRLTGDASCMPLLAGWTFGDFELRLRWSVEEGGTWKIALPAAPAGEPAIVISLGEGDDCGRMTRGAETIAPGGACASTPGGEHAATIRRAEGRLVVEVDGREVSQAQAAREMRLGLSLALDGGGALWDARLAEPAGRKIFNGQDLTGWWTPGNRNSWIVENGELICINRRGNYLRSEEEYANFTLSLEYKMAARGNSGIGIRTARNAWPSGDGMELQLLDRPNTETPNRSSTMAIYGNLEPLALADRSEEWNRVVVKAEGRMLTAWVNGRLVQHANTGELPELKHRRLQGWIGFQDHGARIHFRDVFVLPAPEGLGMNAWRAPRPEPASRQVLDRLMNPERLAVAADGVTSHGVTRRLDGGDEQVLADWSGPGALVRIAHTGDAGRLAFYFDEEDRPRIECAASELYQFLPPVSEDRRPLVTFLGFERRLKIVARGAAPGAIRLDAVALDDNAPVQTFSDREASIARGMLPALSYRHFQISHGTHREHDPLPRKVSPQHTIEPGETVELISLSGAGVVEWIKLLDGAPLLANDDLQLEVTIDGEAAPALAAPARYLFPGLQGGDGFHNFLMLDRDGPTSLLAMPYGDGLRIAARNTGERPIEGVALAVSHQPAAEEERSRVAGLARLRGVFQPAGASADATIFALSGAGRWVGLVLQQPAGGEHGIGSLAIDGVEQAGWAADDLDLFLGFNGETRRVLSGRHEGLAWRYLLLAPVEFRESLVLSAGGGDALGDRLAIFYQLP